MLSEIFEYALSSVAYLGWVAGFYFASIVLVIVSLVPATCRIVAIVADRRILDMTFNAALELLTFAGRLLLLGAILVAGGALAWSELLMPDAWIDVIQAVGAGIIVDWIRVLTQLAVGIGLFWLFSALLSFGLSEYRMAKVAERMQRQYPPHKMRSAILAAASNVVLTPIFMAYVLHIVQVI